MKTNRKNKNKGWQRFFLYVILVFPLFFIESVFALEENSLDMTDEEIIEEDISEVVVLGDEVDSFIQTDEDFNYEEEVVTKEDVWNRYSEKMEFSLNTVVIQDKINEFLKVEDILKNISIESLKNDYQVLEVYVVDELGSILGVNDEITGKKKLVFLGKDYILFYEIQLLGDYTQDGIVNVEDVEEAIDIHSKNPEKLKIEEVSYVDSVVKNNTYEVSSIDVREVFIESKLEVVDQEIFIDELVIINYTLEEIELMDANVIRGEIEFDSSSLEFVDIYFSGNLMIKGKISGNSFIYLLDGIETVSPLLMLVFRPKESGIQQVSIRNIQIANHGILLNSKPNTFVDFLLHTYGTGGDVEDNYSTIKNENINSSVHLVSNSNQHEVQRLEEKPIIQATKVYLNNNNYIEKLEIQGYFFSFDKYQEEYQIEVDDDVDELLFDVVLSDNNAAYFVNGNQNFKVGKNKVVLTVQTEDGSTRNYVIEVNKKRKKEDSIKEEEKEVINQVIFKIVLVVLILAIVWFVYLFIKKEEG